MTAAPEVDHHPGRVVLAAGTAVYGNANYSDLGEVPTALATVVRALQEWGYEPVGSSPKGEVERCLADLKVGESLALEDPPGFMVNPDSDSLQDALTGAATAAPVVVFYYTGHGVKPEEGDFRIAVRAKDPTKPPSLLAAGELVNHLKRWKPGGMQLADEQPHVLVILDCCYSAEVIDEVLSSTLHSSSRAPIWVMATAREEAKQGLFAEALAQALAQADVGSGMPYIPMSEIVRLIQQKMPTKGMNQQLLEVVAPNGRITGDLEPFFPNKAFDPEIAETVGEGLAHWLSRVRGLDDRADLGLYLAGRTGRISAAIHLGSWLTDPTGPGLAAVTGSPGSGKSTLLALPVLLTASEEARTLVTEGGGALAAALAQRVPQNTPVVAIHARGKSADQIAAIIGEHLGETGSSASGLQAWLEHDMPDLPPTVLVIDAVDEAQGAREVVSLLARLAKESNCKVLIGARRHVLQSLPADHLSIDLDEIQYQDRDALTDYIADLLTAVHEPETATVYRDTPAGSLRQIADALAARATSALPHDRTAESFLLGRLLAVAVRGRPTPIDTTPTDWLRHLPASVGEAFDEDIIRRLEDIAPQGRTLLTALAWSRGVGLPREGIWTAIAQALANEAGTAITITDKDLQKVLARVGNYIVEEVGPGGRTASRLFHEVLAQHLRDEPTQEQVQKDADADTSWKQRRRRAEAAITTALLDAGPRDADGGPIWDMAHPYLRTHLAQHASAAEPLTFHHLIQNPDYLAVADPATLTPLLPLAGDPDTNLARVYRRARPLLGFNPHDNAAYLQESAAAIQDPNIRRTMSTGRIRPTYQTEWSLARRDDSLLTLTGHALPVTSVAVGAGSAGNPLVASSGNDGTVRLWDPDSGSQLALHVFTATSVALGRASNGRSLLAAAGTDGLIMVWDADTADEAASPGRAHTKAATSVAFGTDASGELILASGGADGTIRFWDPEEGRFTTPEPIQADKNSVSCVAIGGTDGGQPRVASAGHDWLRLWDVGGSEVETPKKAHRSGVRSVAFGKDRRGRSLIASVGWDEYVRTWTTTLRAAGDPLSLGSLGAESVCAGADNRGRPFIAAAGWDEVALFAPLKSRGTKRTPLVGHDGRVSSVAFGERAGGGSILASAGEDGTVKIWSPTPHGRKGRQASTPFGSAAAVALGGRRDRPLLAAVNANGFLQIWDLARHRPIGPPVVIPPTTIYDSALADLGVSAYRYHFSLAFGTDTDGTALLAVGSSNLLTFRVDPEAATVDDPVNLESGDVAVPAFGGDSQGRPLLASADADGTVRVWDLSTGSPEGKPVTSTGDRVHALAFGKGPSGRPMLAGVHGGRAAVWHLADNNSQIDSESLADVTTVTSVAIGDGPSGSAILVAGSADGLIWILDPMNGSPVAEPLAGHRGRVTGVRFGHNAQGAPLLVSSGSDNTIRLWDLGAGATDIIRRRTYPTSIDTDRSRVAVGTAEGICVINDIGGSPRQE